MARKQCVSTQFIENINGFDVHKVLLENKFTISFFEKGSYTSVHFKTIDDGFEIYLVYKYNKNYRAKQYFEKYYRNYQLINVIQRVIQKYKSY